MLRNNKKLARTCLLKHRQIGLIILFAISIVMAGGRKPKIEPVNVQIRIKSEPEQKTINERYRSTIDLSKYEGKEWYNFRLFVESPKKWGELEGVTLFKKLFPKVVFYKGIVFASWSPGLFAMAEYNGKFYQLPSEFNRLLIANGLEIDERNIIDFAKAFVIAALIEKRVKSSKERIDIELVSFPQITFLEGKRKREFDREWYVEWDAEIKCRCGDTKDVQTWKFSTSSARKGQFSSVDVFINNKRVRAYQVKTYEKEKRGELDEQPKVIIVTTIGNATVEQDSFFYLLTEYNGEPTNYSVNCSLYNFQPNEQNVYIRIKPVEGYPDTAGPNETLGPVSIDGNGKGFYNWTSGFEIKTGIGKVFAGNMPPGDTFRQRTPREEARWLTLEKVVTGSFDTTENYKIYFCHQFFVNHPQGQ